MNDNSHDNKHLQSAWNKYGEDNFEFSVLEVVHDKAFLDEKEIQYIEKFKSLGICYNVLLGGGVVEDLQCLTTQNNLLEIKIVSTC